MHSPSAWTLQSETSQECVWDSPYEYQSSVWHWRSYTRIRRYGLQCIRTLQCSYPFQSVWLVFPSQQSWNQCWPTLSQAYSASCDQIHLLNQVHFVVNNHSSWELTRHESKRDLVKELRVLILLRIEEMTEVEKHVTEQVVRDYLLFHQGRKCLDVRVVYLQRCHSVCLPVVVEVVFYFL